MKNIDKVKTLVGCLVAGLIIAGLVNPAFLSTAMPVIIAGVVALLALYIISAFKNKNFAAVVTILALAVFVVLAIVMR